MANFPGTPNINAKNLGAISLAVGVNTGASDQLTNVSNRTRSTRLQSRDFSTTQPGRDLVSCGCQNGH